MRRILLALILFLLSAAPSGAAAMEIDSKLGIGDAAAVSDVLRDSTGQLSVTDVIGMAGAFEPSASLVSDLRASLFAPSTLWFRLEPRATGPGPWYLHAPPSVDRAEMFFVARDGRIQRTAFGTLVPYANRQLPTRTNTIVLPPAAMSEGVLFIRVVTREDIFGGFSLRPAVWEATIGRAGEEARLLPELVIVGIVGGLALFNALLGWTLRERIYFWYAGATGCFVLLEFVQTGAAWRWLWPHASVMFDVAVYPAYALYLGFVVLFARFFLDLPATQLRLWRAILAIYFVGILADTAFILYPNVLDRYGISGLMDPICSGAMLFAIFSASFVGWRRGGRDARAYAIAFGGVFAGILVGTLSNTHLIAPNGWTEAAPGIGVAWESVFLALALAERISRLRGERDALEVAAFADALTGIPNRRAFDERLAKEWRLAGRAQAPLATIMVDVDLFKSYNDTYGHLAGDRALQLVAQAISRSLRRTEDFVARYGGEEFVVLLPFCDLDGAVAVADKIRATILDLAIVHSRGPAGQLTVSAGAASLVPSAVTNSEQLVAAADRALYDAKRSGRNRVAVRRNALVA